MVNPSIFHILTLYKKREVIIWSNLKIGMVIRSIYIVNLMYLSHTCVFISCVYTMFNTINSWMRMDVLSALWLQMLWRKNISLPVPIVLIYVLVVLIHYGTKLSYLQWTTLDNQIIFWKHINSWLGLIIEQVSHKRAYYHIRTSTHIHGLQ